tara:strand:- start:172 stop:609 length:438 start_codon:yes stop_codon:yes gene_type:complete
MEKQDQKVLQDLWVLQVERQDIQVPLVVQEIWVRRVLLGLRDLEVQPVLKDQRDRTVQVVRPDKQAQLVPKAILATQVQRVLRAMKELKALQEIWVPKAILVMKDQPELQVQTAILEQPGLLGSPDRSEKQVLLVTQDFKVLQVH